MARIQCPTCAAIQVVDDSLQGQAWTCSACGSDLSVGEEHAAEVGPPGKERPRRRRKGRRKRRASSFGGRVRYYTGTFGVFGWVLVALIVLWMCSLVVAVVVPGWGQGLLVAGTALVTFGNVWIGFVAYRDSPVFGMLCFFTCLFTYAYIFMNLEETWKPATLTGLGFLVTLSGLVVSSLSPVPVSAV